MEKKWDPKENISVLDIQGVRNTVFRNTVCQKYSISEIVYLRNTVSLKYSISEIQYL